MMWADMFFQMSGGNYHLDEIEITEEIIKRFCTKRKYSH